MKKPETPIPPGEVTEPGETVGEADLPATTEAATLSPEQLEELKCRAAKADENWERLLRTTADFDNFKKRAARETPGRHQVRQRELDPKDRSRAG